MENTDKLAVLIDADNAQPSIVDSLLAEIANFGIASVKRIYGDWTAPGLKGWKEVLLQHFIQPMQQFAYTKGKNATVKPPAGYPQVKWHEDTEIQSTTY